MQPYLNRYQVGLLPRNNNFFSFYQVIRLLSHKSVNKYLYLYTFRANAHLSLTQEQTAGRATDLTDGPTERGCLTHDLL